MLPTQMLDSPLRSILLVEEMTRANLCKFRSVSPPGHLLHLVVSGGVEQYADDHIQLLGPGSLVWYYQMESIHGRVLKAPWRFISINFVAPALAPPSDKSRVRQASSSEIRKIRALLHAWRNSSAATRSFECFSLLNQLLVKSLPIFGHGGAAEASEELHIERWWRIERKLRLDLEHIPSLIQIARQSGFSLRTLERTCVAATGFTPARRIAALRIAQARHLLQVTRLSVSEIALRVGYPRVQELSRAMRKYTGQTPRDVRAANPDYWKR